MPAFLERLRAGVLLGDGAMGTQLLARGVGNRGSLAEANLDCPDLVLKVHREYREAGAGFHRSNTFTANRLRMPADRVGPANLEGVRLARAAAGRSGFVGGSIGPLHDVKAAAQEKSAAFEEQGRALAGGDCDALILETFCDLEDLQLCFEAVRGIGLPLVAEMTLWAEEFPLRISADLVGTNCVVPARARRVLEDLARSGRVLAAFPSAGAPGAYAGPQEFADETAPLVDLGVRLLGGCCGTSPAHIRALAWSLGR